MMRKKALETAFISKLFGACRNTWLFPPLLLLLTAFVMPCNGAESIWLSSLDLGKVRQDWGQPQKDKSVDGHQITISGKKFEHGLGTHSISTLYVDLKGNAERFTAFVGIDDEVKSPATGVIFRVLGDGRELFKSNVLKNGQAAKKIDVSLKGVKTLLLMVGSAEVANNSNHANWADAKIEYAGEAPESIFSPPEEAVILTPAPLPTPHINGAKVFGVRPNSPFLFTIPATGQRPMKFSAVNLPEGLKLNSQTGRITGSLQKRGEYMVVLSAKNELGRDNRAFKIVCGDNIALTPPMGWSSWNCFSNTVDDAKVRAAADAMVQNDLINHGWSYVNIDNGWQVLPEIDDPLLQGTLRDENGVINPNKKFPDMKALVDYIHEKGLKAGIKTNAPRDATATDKETYKKYTKDIRRFAEWEFDYFKFYWTNYRRLTKEIGLPGLKEPYEIMKKAIDENPRDIVFSVCGTDLLQEWANDIGGNCYRATNEMIMDSWTNVSTIGFSRAGYEIYSRPGHWNDLDFLVVGVVGWGRGLRPTRLTPNEQYTHVSLWCLLSSPLLIGCDLTQLDDFTLNLLTNDEVIEVNQDPLGKQAIQIVKDKTREIWAKEMEDGVMAAGLFNRSESEANIRINWSDLGLTGKVIVRDLWRQQDLGEFENQYTATVGRHGVVLLRLRPSGK
jgi:alpha-galactosidase